MLYTLSYNASGGSGSAPQPVTKAKGFETRTAANTFERTGYEFTGWNTERNGSGTPYVPGGDYTLEGDATLYAQWAVLYTLSYNANGGSGSAPQPVTKRAGEAAVVKNSGGLYYAQHEFKEWNTAADGSGEAFPPGCAYSLKANTRLYAQWEKPATSVTLSSTSRDLKTGESTVLAATVSPAGATHADVIWTSNNESVARVDSGGTVTAVSEGAASIIARAGGAFAVCTVSVRSENSPKPSPTTPDTPTEAPAEPAGPSGESGAAEGEEIPGIAVLTIYVSDLPKGTAALRLPNGETVKVDGSGEVRIEVDAGTLDEDGMIELIPLDGEGVPLGAYFAEGEEERASSSEGSGDDSWFVLIWVLAGICAAAAVLGIYLWRRKAGRKRF